MPVNGSDEALYLAFRAFGGPGRRFAFPPSAIASTPSSAAVTGTQAMPIPLRPDFSIAPADYAGLDASIVIANPNAPTGLALTLPQIESILQARPGPARHHRRGIRRLRHAELRCTDGALDQSPGGADLFQIPLPWPVRGLALPSATRPLIADLNNVRKYSVNPYNVNRLTQAGRRSPPSGTMTYFMTTAAGRIQQYPQPIPTSAAAGHGVYRSAEQELPSPTSCWPRRRTFPARALYAAPKAARGVLGAAFHDTPALTDVAAHHHRHAETRWQRCCAP